MDYRRINEKRKFIFSFLFRLCFYRFSPMFLSLFAYVFIAFPYVFIAFPYVFIAFHFAKPCCVRLCEGSITRTKTKAIKTTNIVLFSKKAKKEVITTIAAKKYLPIDLKSNEMTKNSPNSYLWHGFLVLMVFYLGF